MEENTTAFVSDGFIFILCTGIFIGFWIFQIKIIMNKYYPKPIQTKEEIEIPIKNGKQTKQIKKHKLNSGRRVS